MGLLLLAVHIPPVQQGSWWNSEACVLELVLRVEACRDDRDTRETAGRGGGDTREHGGCGRDESEEVVVICAQAAFANAVGSGRRL